MEKSETQSDRELSEEPSSSYDEEIEMTSRAEEGGIGQSWLSLDAMYNS
jgi:hypothetical protein